MEKGRRRLRGAAIAGVTVAVAVACMAGAGDLAAAPAHPSCERPGSTTLVETGKVRIFSKAEGEVFGCLQKTGRTLPLSHRVEGRRPALVDPQTIAVAGPLVAFALTEIAIDTHETFVRVLNLRTGRFLHTCLAGVGMAPQTFPHLIEIVLDPGGAVAWSAEESPRSESPRSIVACDSAETPDSRQRRGDRSRIALAARIDRRMGRCRRKAERPA